MDAIREQVQQACAAFRAAWRQGERPKIETLLEQHGVEIQTALLPELVKLEWIHRLEANDGPPTIDEYCERFPPHAATLRKVVSESWLDAETVIPDPDMTLTTGDGESHPSPLTDSVGELTQIDRYVLRSKLGEGTYGSVYLAHDSQLDRQVAIKVATPNRVADPRDLVGSLYEARKAVAVESEGIVRVLDINVDHDPPYIVMEYVDGGSLKDKLQDGPLIVEEAVEKMIRLVNALGNAHQKRIFHLDLKPANILLDKQGRPFITDFGFAIHQSHRNRYVGMATGTPAYMAPEQVRREANRYDGSTDLWSLGVIFYEMLTGQRPFDASTRSELVGSILDGTPQPLRQLNPRIPSALERICLKCLAPQQLDRYSSAADLADDLAWWQTKQDEDAEASSPSALTTMPGATVRPQGLRSFDETHADFYLSLLPGPFSRDGLPASVSFWKQGIESQDDDAFSVGVIFGPSGCGKSSLVSAGIVPQLKPHVTTLEVQCTSDGTSTTLEQRLDQQFPALQDEVDLAARIACLRDEYKLGSKKVLIILNQFEQFLHTWDEGQSSDLLEALRHCDGTRVQCVVTVRSDFFHSLSRFMRLAGVPLRERVNMMGVDLFGKKHARRVLQLFGVAFGKLSDPPTADEEKFIEQVIDELARDGKVICVRLAVIAEMIKHREWSLDEWAQVGRAAGVGETFLEETFVGATAPPNRRAHQEAARHVLRALMPDDDVGIKSDGCGYSELMAASQYEDDPAAFEELLAILDDEVRLITPIEQGESKEADSERRYQLAHDYLVPSLRQWLTKKQRESRQGRAELLLEQHTGWWTTHAKSHFLPSMVGWAQIRWWTKSKLWSEPNRLMMRQADRRVLLRGVFLLATTALVVWGYFAWQRQRDEQEVLMADRVRADLQHLRGSEVRLVPEVLEDFRQMEPTQREMMLESLALQDDWRSSFALLTLSQDESSRMSARDTVLAALRDDVSDLDELMVMRTAIEATQSSQLFLDELWKDLLGAPEQKLNATVVLAGLDAQNSQWRQVARPIAKRLVDQTPSECLAEIDVLRAIGDRLIGPLAEIANQAEDDRNAVNAVQALKTYASKEDVRYVMRVAIQSTGPQLEQLIPWLAKHPVEVSEYCRIVLGSTSPTAESIRMSGSPALVRLSEQLRQLHGTLDEDHAWCPPIAREQFQVLVKALAAEGYRPNRMRAIDQAGELLVTASWRRDGARYELGIGLSETELQKQTMAHETSGLLPVDLSVIESRETANLCCVWASGIGDARTRNIELHRRFDDVFRFVRTNNSNQNAKRRIVAVDVMPSTSSEEELAVLWQRDDDAGQRDITDSLDFGIVANRNWIVQDFALRAKGKADQRIGRQYWGDNDALPTQWKLMQWWELEQELHPARFVREAQDPGRGMYSLLLTSPSNADVYVEQIVDIEPQNHYLISGWIKTENVKIHEGGDRGAHLSIFDRAKTASASVSGTEPWTYVTHVLHSGELTQIKLGPRLGNTGSSAEGNAWFDDLCCIRITADEAQSESVSDPTFLTDARRSRNLLVNGSFESLPAVVAATELPSQEAATIELSPPARHKRQADRLTLRGFQMTSIDATTSDGTILVGSVWSRARTLERANAAVILSRCSGLNSIADQLRADTEANTRAQLISQLSIAEHSVSALIAAIQEQDDRAVRQGLLLSMGALDADALSEADRQALRELLRVRVNDPEPAVRAAADWLSHRLRFQLTHSRVGLDRTGTRWVVTSNDHRMVILSHDGQPFAIADAEVTNGQYDEFLKNMKHQGIDVHVDRTDARGDAPRRFVSFYMAVMYCRWLGEMEGIDEQDQYYPPLKVIETFHRDRQPHHEFEAAINKRGIACSGYRLPTEKEWSAAAGPHLDPLQYPRLMMEYGQFDLAAHEQQPTLVRQLKPNLSGVFDMWGNAMEWLQQRSPTEGLTPLYVIVGGSFADPPTEAEHRIIEHPRDDFYRYGFRIAKTWKPKE